MNQQYPGDIAPLMRACAELAQRRADDLARVRASVVNLKSNLARTLVQFDQLRSKSSARVQKLRAHTTQTLTEDRHARSQQVTGLLTDFAKAHARKSAGTRQALNDFRMSLQAEVSALKQQTRVAQRARFRSGSFRVAALPNKAPPVNTSSPAATNSTTQAKRTRARSFLDL
jgi:hypothetical protein